MSDSIIPSTFGGDENQPITNQSKIAVDKSTFSNSEKEKIRYLEEKQTNYIFLFGRPGVGKTAITASILHHLSTNPRYYIEVQRDENNLEGTTDVLQFRESLKNKKFPGRTDIKIVPRNLDITFYPKNNNGQRLTGIPLTFLEISGEDLHIVEVSKDAKLPDNVDIYFKADKISMLFILVTTPKDASRDDNLMNEFLDYISSKDKKYRDAYVSLLITQYDRYKNITNGLNIQDFIKNRMPNSYGRFFDKRNTFGYYSVGEVIEVNETNGKEYHIRRIDEESPNKLFDWIYTTITNKELNPPKLLQKIAKLLNI